ncbi:aldolase [Thalassotalea sp. HSM 43]|uniref:HpcH/HpaI aldolase family protein n=1 Tax=Thalassotalea sp. HSM 43 TaxID=2552945 RepID=UPI001082055A|nr:aldolase/citrate lyase family protein [Thalassotalea sp. HSM 43]QBY04199.1 aldolase [Thalassotalea sp. HSM 43]
MTFKQRLANQEKLLGTFIKTPHYHVSEVLAKTNLDVLCLDAEHAPFDRKDIDACVLACKANNMPVIVRLQDDNPANILNALDMDADGIVIPHVKTAEQARMLSKKCHFGNEGRGFAGSTRFANYTRAGITNTLQKDQHQTTVIAQIEDADALPNVDQICQVDGIDCVFIGRIDLTISLGQDSPTQPSVMEAVERIVDSCIKHQKPCGMFVGNLNELAHWKAKGVQLFLLESDHSFLFSGAETLLTKFNEVD